MAIRDWWADDAAERCWMEATDRDTLLKTSTHRSLARKLAPFRASDWPQHWPRIMEWGSTEAPRRAGEPAL